MAIQTALDVEANDPHRLTPARLVFLVAGVLALVAAGAIYAPGLRGSFFFDDFPQIVNNPSLVLKDFSFGEIIRATFSSDAGPLKRPISMLTFALNQHVSGLDPVAFKLVNVVLHVANSLLVWLLAYQILSIHRRRSDLAGTSSREPWVALAVAVLWAVHPLHVTSVLYVVQRMTSLSSLFVLCGLVVYMAARSRIQERGIGLTWLFAGAIVFGALAVLAKETGALMVLYMLALELTLFRFNANQARGRRGVLLFFGIFVFIPAAVLIAKILTTPEWITGGYAQRAFSLTDRVLTEARILWIYLRQIVLPDIGEMALFHDDIVLSRGWLNPLTTLPAVIGHVIVWVAAMVCMRKMALVALAILWFYFGHALESTVFPLELMHEHRNYLAMLGIVLAIGYYCFSPDVLPGFRRFRNAFGIAFVALLSFSTATRAAQFGDPVGFHLAEAAKHPGSARANYEAGRVLMVLMEQGAYDHHRFADEAENLMRRSMASDPDELLAPLAIIRLSAMTNKSALADALEEFLNRLRTGNPPSTIGPLFRSFHDLVARGGIGLTPRDIKAVFEAALANPKLKGDWRAHVLTSYGLVSLNAFQDPDRAVSLMHEAVAAAPTNPEFHVVTAAILLQADRFAETAEMLENAERLDHFGHVKSDIAALRAELGAAIAKN